MSVCLNWAKGGYQRNRLIKEIDMGRLYLPTGRLVCCDPFSVGEAGPLDLELTPGHYVVRLVQAPMDIWGERVALAAVIFNEDEPDSATPAQRQNMPDKAGIHVESGLACFTDEDTRRLFANRLTAFQHEREDTSYYEAVLEKEFAASASPDGLQTGNRNMHFPVRGDQRNIAMFASGLGDGIYQAEWLMAGTSPCRLVVDFGVLK
ncbi:DUF4241 domain-containing protein [Mesorhizobium sp. M0011]|uniref:DUF4241 domain-containing protein n=1 Tax=Mesorhizobium sp. M0011 TaxID=2956839 RepID=UPI003334C84C